MSEVILEYPLEGVALVRLVHQLVRLAPLNWATGLSTVVPVAWQMLSKPTR